MVKDVTDGNCQTSTGSGLFVGGCCSCCVSVVHHRFEAEVVITVRQPIAYKKKVNSAIALRGVIKISKKRERECLVKLSELTNKDVSNIVRRSLLLYNGP